MRDGDLFFQGGVDIDSFWTGNPNTIARGINTRFENGGISPFWHFETLELDFSNTDRVLKTSRSVQQIFETGHLQAFKSFSNINGNWLLAIISGICFVINQETGEVQKIFGPSTYFPRGAKIVPVETIGGTILVFNFPNNNILISPDGARFLTQERNEVPVSRIGKVAANQLHVVRGFNEMFSSDPFSSDNTNAPITFNDFLEPGSYFGASYSIGSVLNGEKIIALCNLFVSNESAQEFAGNSLVAFGERGIYLIRASVPKSQRTQTQFITQISSDEQIAGERACYSYIGNIYYITANGRIRSFATDNSTDLGFSNFFLDDPLGQFGNEEDFYFRRSYRNKNHFFSSIAGAEQRIYFTAQPETILRCDWQGLPVASVRHKALAVASVSSETQLGSTTRLAWDGFVNSVSPVAVTSSKDDIFVFEVNDHGKNQIRRLSDHPSKNTSRIYTRGYLTRNEGNAVVTGHNIHNCVLQFAHIDNGSTVTLEYYSEGEWSHWGTRKVSSSCVSNKYLSLVFGRPEVDCTPRGRVPLRITIYGTDWKMTGLYIETKGHSEVSSINQSNYICSDKINWRE